MKLPLVYFLGTYFQITGIATAFLLATFLHLVANFLIVHYLIGDFMGIFLRNLAKPLLFCSVMVGVIALYKLVVGHKGITNMAAEVIIGGAAYAALTLAHKLSFAELKAYRQAL